MGFDKLTNLWHYTNNNESSLPLPQKIVILCFLNDLEVHISHLNSKMPHLEALEILHGKNVSIQQVHRKKKMTKWSN